MSNWIQNTIKLARSPLAKQVGGNTTDDELAKMMCSIQDENHYSYWCSNLCDDQNDIKVDFNQNSQTAEIINKYKLNLRQRLNICKKCRDPDTEFWSWEKCQS